MDEQEILELFLQDIKRYPVLTEEESNKLLYSYQVEKNQESYEKLVLHNLGLLVYMAKKYIGKIKKVGLLDLIQESYFIMRKAIASFDPNKEYKLSTYICGAIGHSLQTQIDQQDETIKLPVELQKQERKYYKYINSYYQKKGKEPEEEQIEKTTKINSKTQEKIKKLPLYRPLSLNVEKINGGIQEEIINEL